MGSMKVEHAVEQLKGLLQTRRLRSGDRLPKESELADQLGVSRNSLREAVRAMQTMKILEVRQGDGTYVSDLSAASMMEVLNFAVDVSDQTSVLWFLELRRTLEMASVRDAVVHRTDDDLGKLDEIHEQTLIEKDPDQLMKLDTKFHNMIAQIACNPVHTSLLRIVSAPTLRARIGRQRLADLNYTSLRQEHDQILKAIRSQNVEDAQYAMWGHISGVIHWVKNHPDALEKMESRHE